MFRTSKILRDLSKHNVKEQLHNINNSFKNLKDLSKSNASEQLHNINKSFKANVTNNCPKLKWKNIKDIDLENGAVILGTVGAGVGALYGFGYNSYNYITASKDDANIIKIPLGTFLCTGLGFVGGSIIGYTYPISIPTILLLIPVYGIRKIHNSTKDKKDKCVKHRGPH
jgi:hypothetical protein